eukprot:6184504-Pleurochrysis_carterae.AAC.1
MFLRKVGQRWPPHTKYFIRWYNSRGGVPWRSPDVAPLLPSRERGLEPPALCAWFNCLASPRDGNPHSNLAPLCSSNVICVVFVLQITGLCRLHWMYTKFHFVNRARRFVNPRRPITFATFKSPDKDVVAPFVDVLMINRWQRA